MPRRTQLGPFRRQLQPLLRAVAVESPTCYRWLGHTVATSDVEDLRADLERRLYFGFYCVGRPVLRSIPGPRPPWASAAFVEALSGANHGSGMWAPGWTVV